MRRRDWFLAGAVACAAVQFVGRVTVNAIRADRARDDVAAMGRAWGASLGSCQG